MKTLGNIEIVDGYNGVSVKQDHQTIFEICCPQLIVRGVGMYELHNICGEDETGSLDLTETLQLKIISIDGIDSL